MNILDEMTGSQGYGFRATRPTWPLQARTEIATSLCSTEEIDDMIASGTLSHPMVTMAREGYRLRPHMYSWNGESSIPGHEFRLRPALVAEQYAAGSSVIVESLHLMHQEIARVTRELTWELGTYVTACAFLAPPHSQGFAHHFDTHDAFVVQVEGSKRWELFEPPLNQPVEKHYFEGVDAYPGLRERIDGPPFLSFTMLPGDVLFLPRGWIHNVYATDEQSLHLNFALTARTRHWVLTKVLESLVESEWARQEVRAPEIGGRFSSSELRDIGDNFAHWVQANAEGLSDSVGLAFADGIPERKGRPIARANSLPVRMEDSILVDKKTIRGSRPDPAGTELILIDNENVVVPKGLDNAVLSAAKSGSPLAVSLLASMSDEQQAIAVCADLVLLGVAELVRD